MSFPNIPNVTPTISLTTAQTVPLLLASIAFEELGLAHMINAEAEKLQMVLGTLPGGTKLNPGTVTVTNLLDIDTSVQRTLKDIIKKEMLLEFKFENILELLAITSVISPITPPPTVPCGCQVTQGGASGGDFNITKGGPSANNTVIFDTAKQTPNGGPIIYNGLICSSCSPNSNFFTYSYTGSAAIGAFTFKADTFTVPPCPGTNASITMTGTLAFTSPPIIDFGPTPTFILNVDNTTGNKSIQFIITGNTHTFSSTTTVGNGEITISKCPA
ncbi:hypothetical protein ACFDTO_26720 [Microbacteriaceae bacterium 4G12]